MVVTAATAVVTAVTAVTATMAAMVMVVEKEASAESEAEFEELYQLQTYLQG